jgi:hypothetical protein
MRFFLRNVDTAAYFKAQGVWTTQLDDACEFTSSDRAVEVAHELRLQNVEVLAVSPDGELLFGTRLKIDP